MGVRGKDVGGLWNEATGAYFLGAEPMSNPDDLPKQNINIPLIIGCTAGGLIAGIIVTFLYLNAAVATPCRRNRRKTPWVTMVKKLHRLSVMKKKFCLLSTANVSQSKSANIHG